jgi:hypothetical protein
MARKVVDLRSAVYEIVAVQCSPWEIMRRTLEVGLRVEMSQAAKRILGSNSRVWYPHAGNTTLIQDCAWEVLTRRFADAQIAELASVAPTYPKQLKYKDSTLEVFFWRKKLGVMFAAKKQYPATEEEEFLFGNVIHCCATVPVLNDLINICRPYYPSAIPNTP